MFSNQNHWRQICSVFIVIGCACLGLVGGQVRPQLVERRARICVYGNKTYSAGQRFEPSPCWFCRCPRRGGRVRCAIQDCLVEPSCVRTRKALDGCCGVCEEFGCRHTDGQTYPLGAIVKETACERCHCPASGGRVVCDHTPCPHVFCVDPVTLPGECCPRCPEGNNCLLGEHVLAAGKMVAISECRRCQCPTQLDQQTALPGLTPTATCHDVC